MLLLGLGDTFIVIRREHGDSFAGQIVYIIWEYLFKVAGDDENSENV